MKEDRNLGPLLIILVVLLVAVLGNWLTEHSWQKEPWNIGFILEAEAPKGSVVDGFPIEFVNQAVDTKIQASAKYRFESDEGEIQVLSTTYDTQAKIADLFGAYVHYLTERGYTITKTEARGVTSNITASLGQSTVAISLYALTAKLNEVRVDIKKPVIQ